MVVPRFSRRERVKMLLGGFDLSFPVQFACCNAGEGDIILQELEKMSGKELEGQVSFHNSGAVLRVQEVTI